MIMYISYAGVKIMKENIDLALDLLVLNIIFLRQFCFVVISIHGKYELCNVK